MQHFSNSESATIAAALGKFSLQEYGKLKQRELDRIGQELAINSPPLEPNELKRACYTKADQSWRAVIATLSPEALKVCATGAKSVAKGSGRTAIPAELARRITVLFEGATSTDDIDFSYQDYLIAKREAELQDVLVNGPMYLRKPRWRLTMVSGQQFDCSSIPAYTGRIRITLFRFDHKAEFAINAKEIRKAIDLLTGEEFTTEKFLRIF